MIVVRNVHRMQTTSRTCISITNRLRIIARPRTAMATATPFWTRTIATCAAATPCTAVSDTTTTRSMSSVSSSSSYSSFRKIAFIGAGMMAQAILEPLTIQIQQQQPAQQSPNVFVYDVNEHMLDQVVHKFPGVQAAHSLSELVQNAQIVVCAVKPQNLTPSFFQELRKGRKMSQHSKNSKNNKSDCDNDHDDDHDDAILLSIVAGKSMAEFEKESGFTKIVRSMPNTPATIGQGMTVWSCSNNLRRDERQNVRDILATMGKQLYVDDESFIDMATSISGSGPAYIFMLMEAMMDAGVHMGMPRDTAATLVYHTMLGSTLYAMQTREHPAILRNSVTSPSGTTASALYELENGKFRTVIKDAMWACYRRSLEMGNHDSNVGPGRTPTRIVATLENPHDLHQENDDNDKNKENSGGKSSSSKFVFRSLDEQDASHHHERERVK